jgi:hypothetical protein
MITDIRKSCCDRRSDLVTAIFLSKEGYYANGIKSLDDKSLLVLESATAEQDNPEIGVHCGDHFIRILARPDHGLMVGDEIQFGKD